MFYVKHGADELTPHLLADLGGDLWAAGVFERRLAGRELAFAWDDEGFVDL